MATVPKHGGKLQRIRDYRRPNAPPDSLLQEHDFTGVHIADVRAIARLPLDKCDVIDTLYGPMLQDNEEIGTIEVAGFWAALDTPKLLLQTSSYVLRDASRFSVAPLPTSHADGLWFYNPDNIAGDAKFAPPVFLGAHVTVEPGASVGPNVVADGVTIRAGAKVANAILYGMGEIDGEWTDCVAVAGKVAALG